MKGRRYLERLVTRHLVGASLALAASILGLAYLAAVTNAVTLDQLAKGADLAIKCVAAVVGSAWALNRYFTGRVDEFQIRVDASVDVVAAGAFTESPDLGLLITRLDIVNTGKVLLPEFGQVVVVDEVFPSQEGVKSMPIFRWPISGLHPGPPIEPGSWSAINFACPIKASTAAVRIYLEVYVAAELRWTWHKTFKT